MTVSISDHTELAGGLVFPEGPRWHAGQLWLSDMHAHRVCTVDLDGTVTTVAELDDMPSGLGFMPDGSLLVACMRTRQIRRVQDGQVTLHSDLSGYPGEHLNDMVVDAEGRCYVGCRSRRGSKPSDMLGKESTVRDLVVIVDPDGSSRVGADDMIAPNGSVISAEGKTLIVAETRANRLTAFDIAADGSLSNRREYADVDPLLPDGIALDAEGGVWFGSPITGVFARCCPGGEITHRIDLPEGRWAVACTLGGPDRRTLFLLTAVTTLENLGRLHKSGDDASSESVGRVEVVRVDVPGAGIP